MAIFKLHITHVFINSFGKERWPFLNYTLIFLVRENSDYDLQIDLSHIQKRNYNELQKYKCSYLKHNNLEVNLAVIMNHRACMFSVSQVNKMKHYLFVYQQYKVSNEVIIHLTTPPVWLISYTITGIVDSDIYHFDDQI